MKNTELLQAIGAVDDRWLLDLDRAMAHKVKPRRKLGKTLQLTAAIMARVSWGWTPCAARRRRPTNSSRPRRARWRRWKTRTARC